MSSGRDVNGFLCFMTVLLHIFIHIVVDLWVQGSIVQLYILRYSRKQELRFVISF